MENSQELAWRCAKKLYSNDTCSGFLGMTIEDMDKGYAVVNMVVSQHMLNGFPSCHGGMIFTLADSAFAFACNSENQIAVGAGCNIEYLRPGKEGDTLTATAQVKYQGKTTGTYDVEVTNQEQQIIALFRGKAHRLGTQLLGINND
jgi:acyl-CoA thioesterase